MKLLLLNGHPGSGKTTVAQELRSVVPRLAILDVDLFRKFVSDYNYSPKDISLMWSVTQALIETYMKNGVSVLVDRCVDDNKSRLLLKKLAKKHNSQFHEVVLYTKTLNCAVDRVQNRPMKSLSKSKVTKINKRLISSLRKQVMKDAQRKDIISFDTETLSIQKVVQEVSNILLDK